LRRGQVATLIGIDSNVLARYIVRDEPQQTALATSFIEKVCTEESPGFIGHIVMCELVWVLRQTYKLDKGIIVDVLAQVLRSKELEVEDTELCHAALRDFRTGPADFADYLLAQRNYRNGCRYTVTFDRKAARHDFFRLLIDANSMEEVS